MVVAIRLAARQAAAIRREVRAVDIAEVEIRVVDSFNG
jgi:hypothetical protein